MKWKMINECNLLWNYCKEKFVMFTIKNFIKYIKKNFIMKEYTNWIIPMMKLIIKLKVIKHDVKRSSRSISCVRFREVPQIRRVIFTTIYDYRGVYVVECTSLIFFCSSATVCMFARVFLPFKIFFFLRIYNFEKVHISKGYFLTEKCFDLNFPLILDSNLGSAGCNSKHCSWEVCGTLWVPPPAPPPPPQCVLC